MTEIPPFDLNRFTLPDDYLIAIGKLTYQWGSLESLLELAIAKLFGFAMEDPKPSMMIAHMSWPQRMDVLETIINYLSPEYPHLERFKNVKPLLKKAQEGRNRIAHAKLGMQSDDSAQVHIMRLTARGKLETSVKPISVAEIEAIRLDIGNAATELLKLILSK